MKKHLLSFAIALTFCCAANAQSNDVTHVTWEPDKACCDEIYVEGVRIRYLTEGNITVALYALDVDGFYAMAVQVENKTDGRVLVDPTQSRLVTMNKRKELIYLQPIPTDKVAKKIAGRGKWGNIFRSFVAGLATRQGTSTTEEYGNFNVYGPDGTASGTYNGNSRTTTTQPDYEAQRRVAQGNARRRAEARDEAELARDASLKTTTLFPSKRIHGFIFFEHKDIPRAIFRIMVGPTVYNFRLNIKG